MRKLVATLLLFAAVAVNIPIHAQLAPSDKAPVTVRDGSDKTEPNEADLQTHGHYVNKAGQAVHSPAKSVDGKVPAGASAKCRDGSYSFSKHRRGTCSGHGGVGDWL